MNEPPTLRTARRAGLIDQVIEQLTAQVRGGGWPIGSRIPTETELAQLTGTSRNTVREAVQSLVHAGLLERRQGSGTYVLAANELAGAVGRQLVGAHLQHVLEVRRALEVGAARLAARRRTDDDVALLRSLIARRNAASDAGSVHDAASWDAELHRAIGQAAHNPVLTDLYENFVSALVASVHASVGDRNCMDPDEHVPLVEAIAAGDAEAAAAEAAGYLDAMLARPTLP